MNNKYHFNTTRRGLTKLFTNYTFIPLFEFTSYDENRASREKGRGKKYPSLPRILLLWTSAEVPNFPLFSTTSLRVVCCSPSIPPFATSSPKVSNLPFSFFYLPSFLLSACCSSRNNKVIARTSRLSLLELCPSSVCLMVMVCWENQKINPYIYIYSLLYAYFQDQITHNIFTIEKYINIQRN